MFEMVILCNDALKQFTTLLLNEETADTLKLPTGWLKVDTTIVRPAAIIDEIKNTYTRVSPQVIGLTPKAIF